VPFRFRSGPRHRTSERRPLPADRGLRTTVNPLPKPLKGRDSITSSANSTLELARWCMGPGPDLNRCRRAIFNRAALFYRL
jgi:hypothetical protein